MSERHPVVGSWRVTVQVPGAPEGLNLATLSLDGGVLVTFPSPTPAGPGAAHRLEYWTPAIGRWEPTGDRGATMSFLALGADENGNPIGTHAITATATAAEDGQGWSGPFTITIAGPDDSTLASISGTVSASRLTA